MARYSGNQSFFLWFVSSELWCTLFIISVFCISWFNFVLVLNFWSFQVFAWWRRLPSFVCGNV